MNYKLLYYSLLTCIVSSTFFEVSALSQNINGRENYPGRMEVKNVNGIGKNITNDFFSASMNYQYPFVFPSGSRGMTPKVNLSYSSNTTDSFSPYGYGFSLSLPRIQRSMKKGVSELYVGDEYTAFGNDLIPETGSKNYYRSKDGSDLNLYILSGSSWIIHTPEGNILTFGDSPLARISDPESPTKKIFAWQLTEERDAFGHKISYNYMKSGNQSYISDIYYGYDLQNGDPIYQIHFMYKEKKASISSFRTQFEIRTDRLLSDITLQVSGKRTRGYSLKYDDLDVPISHLKSITELTEHAILPDTVFSYGEGQFRHLIVGIENKRGGKATFEYTPSTTYRDGSGELLNKKLPFIVMTLSKQRFEDGVTGVSSEEFLSYSGGHYFYDASDIFGREYVGFSTVTTSDRKTKKVYYFHQSQAAIIDPLKYEDHISKKGRIYRTDIFDKQTGKILQKELTKIDSRVIFGDRRLVFPIQKVSSEFAPSGEHRDTASVYEYDFDGNMTREIQYGLVEANLINGTFIDTPGDMFMQENNYTSNHEKNLYHFPTSEKIYGFSGELLRSMSIEYDNIHSGVLFGLPTSTKRENALDNAEKVVEKNIYLPNGMLSEKIDALGNRSSFQYDDRNIALIVQKNPLNWEVKYVYNYALGKNIEVINQNSVTLKTGFDEFGREISRFRNDGGGEVLLSSNEYDDLHIPNSTTTTQYFTNTGGDRKIDKVYQDGWGRAISKISTTNIEGKHSSIQIRYDDRGNPIFSGYPYFSSTDSFDTNSIFSGSTEGELYRKQHAGTTYIYDSLDRIVLQIDDGGTTRKEYLPGKETLINALGNITDVYYNAFGQIIKYVEKIDQRDIVTQYSYDALGHLVGKIDTYGNIRNWLYDGFGRLRNATDLHTISDTTFGKREYGYDDVDRVVKYRNPNNEILLFTYDPLSRIIKESTESGSLDRVYTYDLGDRSLGTLSSVSDSGSTVVYSYDPLGNKTREVRKIEDSTYDFYYAYNTASILTSISYPDRGSTKYLYSNGFLSGIDYLDSSGRKNTILSNIEYAPNSSMKKIQYGNGTLKDIERDSSNNYRLLHSRSQANDGTPLLDTLYSYDALGNINQIQENGIEPLRKTVKYSYDALSRLKNANYMYSIPGFNRDQNRMISYEYDDIGNIINNSSVGSYQYEGIGYANPFAVTHASDSQYTYDQQGNIHSRSDPKKSYMFSYSPYGEMTSSVSQGVSSSYLYDYTHRRILKKTPGIAEHHVIDGYEVDYEDISRKPLYNVPAGVNNAVNSTISSLDSVSVSSGLILAEQTGSINSSSGATLSGFVDDGKDDIPISSNSGSQDEQISISSGEINKSSIVYSGSTIIDTGSTILLSDYHTLPAMESGGILEVRSTYIVFGDEKIATIQSQIHPQDGTNITDIVYHISDHLSSSSVDLSSSGILLQVSDYLPFGEGNVYEVTSKRMVGIQGGYTNKYRFSNKEIDEETGLQYFEKRYYDPRIGKFTSEDPVTWEVGITKRPNQYLIDPQQWNMYSYVRNNPINLVDPSGEMIDYSKILYDDRENGGHTPYYQATNFSINDADQHYFSENGTAIGVSLNEIDTSFITPLYFSSIRNVIKAGVPGVYEFKKNDAKDSISTRFYKDRSLYGNLTFKAEGSLTIGKYGSWSFQGKLKSFNDLYDFTITEKDKEDVTRWPRNVVTYVWDKLLVRGKPFDIQIHGEKELKGGGVRGTSRGISNARVLRIQNIPKK